MCRRWRSRNFQAHTRKLALQWMQVSFLIRLKLFLSHGHAIRYDMRAASHYLQFSFPMCQESSAGIRDTVRTKVRLKVRRCRSSYIRPTVGKFVCRRYGDPRSGHTFIKRRVNRGYSSAQLRYKTIRPTLYRSLMNH